MNHITTLQTASQLHTQAATLYAALVRKGAPDKLTTAAYNRTWRRFELVNKVTGRA